MNYSLRPLGDHAVVIQLGETIETKTHEKVKRVTSFFEQKPIKWVVELIPAFTTVTLYYDPIKVIESEKKPEKYSPYDVVCSEIERLLKGISLDQSIESRVVEIPVCYGGEWGPDLGDVAKHNDLSKEEVISKHAAGEYLVYMIGFAPGFPYIGGMSPDIATPRRDSPRLKIPAGTVGIAGEQTGVYPIETPGGWQLIGRTPLKLFTPENESSPSLLRAGDTVRFKPISFEEYKEMEEEA